MAVKVIKISEGFEFPELNMKIVKTPQGYKIEGSIVPSGLITMWSGTIANIPDGWHLCDGTEGTPDLRDRFILSVSAEEEPGGIGGAHNKILSVANLPTHTHGSAGTHFHTLPVAGGTLSGLNEYMNRKTYVHSKTSSAGIHTHSNVGSGTAFDNRPAYYKLAYIMKL